jgi:excisionase family DNA binding protein
MEADGMNVTDRLALRPTEVAEAIGVSRSTAYELIANGAIPSVRFGTCVRVPVLALQEYIARQAAAKAE